MYKYVSNTLKDVGEFPQTEGLQFLIFSMIVIWVLKNRKKKEKWLRDIEIEKLQLIVSCTIKLCPVLTNAWNYG